MGGPRTLERVRQKRFPCSTCDATFPMMAALLRHLYLNRCPGFVNASSTDTTCDRCGAKFGSDELLHHHRIFDTCKKLEQEGSNSSENLFDVVSAKKLKMESPKKSRVETFQCPVDTCRRSFAFDREKRSHILKTHATWDLKCVTCELKFSCGDEVIDHVTNEHASPEAIYDANLVRVKTEEILEDVKIKVESKVEIKKEDEDETDFGVVKVENEICDAIKIKSETNDVVNVKIEPGQDL